MAGARRRHSARAPTLPLICWSDHIAFVASEFARRSFGDGVVDHAPLMHAGPFS
jgi:hypothetical protein